MSLSRFVHKRAFFSILLILVVAASRLDAQQITGFGTSEKNPFNPATDYLGGWTGSTSSTTMTVSNVNVFGGGVYQALHTPVTVTDFSSITLTGTLTHSTSDSTFFITFFDAQNDQVGYQFNWAEFGPTSTSVPAQLLPDSVVGTMGPIVSWTISTSGGPLDSISFIFDDLSFGGASSSGGGGSGGGGGIGTTKQTITFPVVAAQTFSTTPFQLNATASSGSPVTYAYVSGPATVSSSGLVTLTGVGTVVVQANQAGDSIHAAAPPVNRSFTVKAAAASVTFSNLAATYNGSPQAATAGAESPSGALNVTLTYAGKATEPTNAGSYAVVATVNDPRYTGSAKGTFVIAKSTAATIDLENLNYVYNGLGHAATATTSNPSGLVVTLAYNGKATLPVLPGTYAVTGTINNANYMGTANAVLTVGLAPTTLYQGATDAEVTQQVNPSGVATTVHYEYGTSSNTYTGQTASQNLGAGKLPVNIFALFPGLAPNTTYYYRLVTVTAAGPTFSSELSFTTLNFDTAVVLPSGADANAFNTSGVAITGKFASFGNPAVNVDDTIAFTGTLALAPGITAANHTGIWTIDSGNTQHLVAQINTAATPASGTNGNFLSLSDPLINDAGNVAFRATAGKPAIAGIFCTDNSGIAQPIALQGGIANGTGGGKFATFTTLGLSQTAGPVVYATLALDKTAGVTAANNAGIFEGTSAANFHCVLRTGDVVSGETITKLVFQPTTAVVNGQSRSFNSSGDIVAQATFSDKTIGNVSVVNGTKKLVVTNGAQFPQNRFATIGMGAISNTDGGVAFVGTVFGAVPAQKNVFTLTDPIDSIDFGNLTVTGTGPLAAPINGGSTTFTLVAPGDPVWNGNSQKAYLSTYAIGSGRTAVAGTLVYSQGNVIACQGGQAPGCPAGATFKSFTELALPDQGGANNEGGVVFSGTLNANAAAGVNAANAIGIWAVDSVGHLQLVVRTGDIINGKTITSVTFLPAPLYVNGSTRSFAQANGDLVYLATFSDKSTAIISVVFP